jgi:hypothetical protein
MFLHPPPSSRSHARHPGATMQSTFVSLRKAVSRLSSTERALVQTAEAGHIRHKLAFEDAIRDAKHG